MNWIGPVGLMTALLFGCPAAFAQTVTVSPTTGHPGLSVNVSGASFGVKEAVDVYFDTTDELLGATNGSGAFGPYPMTVPTSALPGTHWITAIGRKSGDTAQTTFTVETNWSDFHFGIGRLGRNPYENVIGTDNVSDLGVVWTAPTGNSIGSSPAVVNGTVYVGSEDDKLYAFNAATGALRSGWPVTTGALIDCSPAVANGVVYVGSDKLYAFKISGALLWSATTGAQIYSSPVVANGVVYVGSGDDKLYAFNATTGAALAGWPVTTGNFVESSPAVANGVVYVGSGDDKLYALNATTGALLSGWPVTTGSYVISSPAVASGVVYVGSDDDKLYAFNAISGALLSGWPVTTGAGIESAPAVSNGAVYVGSKDDKLYAFNATTGALLSGWPVKTGNFITSSPAVANGVVYVGSGDDKLYAFNRVSGALLWTATTGNSIGASPAVANGMVYVGSRDNNLYAYAIDAGNNAIYKRGRQPPSRWLLQPDWRLKPAHGETAAALAEGDN